ncbi:MAG: hypothetical protein QXV17_15165 [Candidatus Micrarchaeaceae archaeon]
MKVVLSKNGMVSHVIFRYIPKFHTATAQFGNRNYYVNTRKPITERDFEKLVNKYIGIFQRNGIKTSIDHVRGGKIGYSFVNSSESLTSSVLFYFSRRYIFDINDRF